MQDANISFEKRDNCFVDVGDVARAQALLDEQLRTHWETVLGDLVREYHPVHVSPMFEREPYYWSADETEWATDVMFRSRKDLAEVYPGLVRHSDPDGPASWQKLRKGVADLHRRAELSQASNERYLEDLASVEHTESLGQSLVEPCRSTTRNGRRVRALNPFHSDDAKLLAILRAHHLIKKVQRTHRYILTDKGRLIIIAILAAQKASTRQLMQLAILKLVRPAQI